MGIATDEFFRGGLPGPTPTPVRAAAARPRRSAGGCSSGVPRLLAGT